LVLSDSKGDGAGFTLANGAQAKQAISSRKAPSGSQRIAVVFDENWTDCWPMERDTLSVNLAQGHNYNLHEGYQMGRVA